MRSARVPPAVRFGFDRVETARQGRIRLGDRAVARLDDVFHGAGAVITRSTDNFTRISPEARAVLSDLRIDLVALSGSSDNGIVIDDVDRCYRRWFDELGVDTVFICPDFHLYGSATANDTADLVHGFVTRLGTRHASSVHTA